jgi:SANT/Myb-like domain of DAMP1
MKQVIDQKLYNLIGGLPAVIPSLDWKRPITPAKKWEMQKFSVVGRPDISVSQWGLKDEQQKIEPIQVNVSQWSTEFYQKFLIDANWTKEETLKLFEMCRTYDVRFPVIYDRWDATTKSIAEMKNRYYQVSRIVMQQDGKSMQEVNRFQFDLNRETTRIDVLERLMARFVGLI